MADDIIHAGPRTTAPVEAGPAETRSPSLPEFIPLPSGSEVEFYSGLKRSSINALVLPCAANDFRPPVRSVSMRRPGHARGKRLVVLCGNFGAQKGLLTYLRELGSEVEQRSAWRKHPAFMG